MNNLIDLKNNCGKKDLLVAYLYDAASLIERRDFEHHLPTCSECRTELIAFNNVREELNSWQVSAFPALEVHPPRAALNVLREFFRLVPAWFKVSSGLAGLAAAVLVLFALAGTRITFGQGGLDASFGVKNISTAVTSPVPLQAPPATAEKANFISRAEAEKIIQAAIARTQAQGQEQTKLQLANLEARLTALHQAQLKTATFQLRQQEQKHLKDLMADGSRQTLTEWLFAASDTGTDSQERIENEKSN